MRSEATAVPFARPPCPIGLIMFKFARKKHRNQYFVNGTLNRHNRDETKDSMRCVPKLEEPLHSRIEYDRTKIYRKAYEKFEEPNHADCTKYVGNGCHDCTKPHAARVKHWPKEEGDEEEDK